MQRVPVLGLIVLLASCSQGPEETREQVAVQDTAPPLAAIPASLPDTGTGSQAPLFSTAITLRQLMQSVIDPNAQALWTAVSYVATESGVKETMPVTDADWDALLQSAITLAESGNALLVADRPVADASYETERRAFQFSAAEIAERRVKGAENWDVIARGMQDLVLETLDAVQRRDIFALTEKGAVINEACEACHASFWYRPQ